MERFSSGTHATIEHISMQGWGSGTYQPIKKHAVQRKVNVVAVAEEGRRRCALQEYRITLEKDVAKLQKKLRQEVDTHKALERAFRRTLGVLPRFSAHLSPKIQELLAEVAVLEEEVINLEECIVSLRQGLYHEAVCLSTSKQQKEQISHSEPLLTKVGPHHRLPLQSPHPQCGPKGKRNPVIAKLLPPVMQNKSGKSYSVAGRSHHGEPKKSENVGLVSDKLNSQKNHGYAVHGDTVPSPLKEVDTPRVNLPFRKVEDQEVGLEKENKQETVAKLSRTWSQSSHSIGDNPNIVSTLMPRVESSYLDIGNNLEPNLLSEEMVHCLSNIFQNLTKTGSLIDCETPSSVSHSTLSSDWSFSSRNSVNYKQYMDITDEMGFHDPYRICTESSPQEIGPYKYFHDITASSLDYSRIPSSAGLLKRLMVLVDKLRIVNLRGLTHQQKLAFWINIYNVCMMHAFLEHGVPNSPQKVVALMGKAVLNVGGHLLSALAIEHFILRLPSDLENINWKSREKEKEGIMRSTYGLEWPEPFVSFALSCGSWSSPAVRIFTPLEVDNELEIAKNEYLQAAVGVTPTKVVIPKLLDWYMRDFAKNVESLVEWISEQLPGPLNKSVQRCLANRQGRAISEIVEVRPYDFNFRYIFAVQPM